MKTNPGLASSIQTQNTSNYKLHCITIHPSQPYVAYAIFPTSDEITSSGHPDDYGAIVVQHLYSRQIMYSMNFGDLVALLVKEDLSFSPSKVHKLIKEQLCGGYSSSSSSGSSKVVQYIEFMDPSTIYWNGFDSNEEEQSSGDESSSDNSPVNRRYSYLMVQFQSRILILNLRQDHVSIFNTTTTTATNMKSTASSIYTPIIADMTAESLTAARSRSEHQYHPML